MTFCFNPPCFLMFHSKASPLPPFSLSPSSFLESGHLANSNSGSAINTTAADKDAACSQFDYRTDLILIKCSRRWRQLWHEQEGKKVEQESGRWCCLQQREVWLLLNDFCRRTPSWSCVERTTHKHFIKTPIKKLGLQEALTAFPHACQILVDVTRPSSGLSTLK